MQASWGGDLSHLILQMRHSSNILSEALPETMKQRTQLTHAQISDPQKPRGNKYVLF